MSDRSLTFYTLDVFTDTAFCGNPLAVFPDAEGLDSKLMQKIAREINLSETVFIGQSTAPNRFTIRIFTPTQEMPFAGHPTVGTALLLNQLEMLNTENAHQGNIELVLEEGVGDIKVNINLQDLSARFQTAVLPELTTSPITTAQAAQLLGLETEKVIAEPFIASCGYPFHMIELKDKESLANVQLDTAFWSHHLGSSMAPEIYLYCRDDNTNKLRTRMFAPAAGIAEDPATGSAAAALAGALAMRLNGDGVQELEIEQGIEMGRPSLIKTNVCYRSSQVESVFISGQAVLISEGRLKML